MSAFSIKNGFTFKSGLCVCVCTTSWTADCHHPQGIYVSPCVFVEGLRDILCECLEICFVWVHFLADSCVQCYISFLEGASALSVCFFFNLLWHFQLLESLKNRFNRQQKLTLFPSLVLAALCMCNTAHSITYVAQDPFCRLVLSEYVINVLFFTFKFRSPLE